MNQVVPMDTTKPTKKDEVGEIRAPRGYMSEPAKPTWDEKNTSELLDIRKIRRKHCPEARQQQVQQRRSKRKTGIKQNILQERKWWKSQETTATNGEQAKTIGDRIRFLSQAANGHKEARQTWERERNRPQLTQTIKHEVTAKTQNHRWRTIYSFCFLEIENV